MQSWPLLAAIAANATPADSATSSLVTYILGYGVLGIVAVAFAFRFIVPRSAVEDARSQARADLLAQVERLERQIEQLQREKKEAADQRDEQAKFAQVQLVPLLVNFTSATSALIPLLQELVRYREGGGSDPRRHR